MKAGLLALSAGGIAILVTGCARGGSQPAPTYYQLPPAYQGAPPYRPAAQTANPDQPGPALAPHTEAQPGPVASAGPVVQGAPAPQADGAPSSPGPDYLWMPSYWTMGLNGGWVWVGGHYVLRHGASEEQLRAARGMLEQARAGLTGKPLKSIDKAIDQVNEALQVR